MAQLRKGLIMSSWLKAFSFALCTLMASINTHAIGIGVQTGCQIAGRLGGFTTGVDPCVPFSGFAVDHVAPVYGVEAVFPREG